MRGWVFNPHVGGLAIPAAIRAQIVRRIEAYAAKNYAGKYTRLDVRFRGSLCYIDAFTTPPEPSASLLELLGETREKYFDRVSNVPLHLCRLRFFGNDNWSLAFYTYSNERYEPCAFKTGEFIGSLEDGFEIGATYLKS